MTIDELKLIRKAARDEIIKRSGASAFKAAFVGHERLEDVKGWLAAAYRLSEEDQQTIEPVKGSDVSAGIAGLVSDAKIAKGLKSIPPAETLLKLGKTAHKNKRVIKTVQTLASHGLQGASQVARTGKVATKATKGTPWGVYLAAAYTVGTAGWFMFSAFRYSDACFALQSSRIVGEDPPHDV